jgi:serine/threonine-protein kinase
MFDPRASAFWQASLRSGLIDAESLSACWDAIKPTVRDAPEHINRRLARQAVRANLVTFWQAQQLLAGKTSGYRIDRYLVQDLIGQGGMGQVYLARDTRLGRLVALKILSAERMSKPAAVARFQREARVGAQLQHENLVRIYDFGESKGRYFLVMEYIEGKTIAALLSERGPMPWATAVRLVRQVALGLEHVHGKGLIHRDVNPYNIIVTRDGTAKLADLGLAIAQAEQERVTRDGATVGTFDYVAPEQARDSRAADARSDIYSLGCTLYHMCAGRVPFPSPSLPEKLLGHQAIEPEQLWRIVPGLPEGLSALVERMMRKRPDQRYATPREVALALEIYECGNTAAAHGGGDDLPLLEPLAVDSVQEWSDAPNRRPTGPVAYLVQAAASLAGIGSGRRWIKNRESGSDADDATAPVLTPDDDFDDNADEVRLILDQGPEPSSSEGRSRFEPQSMANEPVWPSLAAAIANRRRPAWFWRFVVLAAIVTVLVVIVATISPTGRFFRGPATERPVVPSRAPGVRHAAVRPG